MNAKIFAAALAVAALALGNVAVAQPVAADYEVTPTFVDDFKK